MKNIFCTLFVCLLFVSQIFAQLGDGDTAPNFDLDDLGGTSHELYDYLDQGYAVVLDFSATWCPPCWSYHNSGVLDELWEEYGPGGTDQVMVFMIEADPSTSQQCIYGPAGCSGGSIGNWTAGVNYPILNPPASEASQVNNDFNISYYPTLYGVAPNKKIYEIGQASVSEWETWLLESFQLVFSEAEVSDVDCEVSDIDLMIEGGYGNVDIEWSNGSDEEDQYGVENGSYYVTLTDDHNFEFELGPIQVDNEFIAELELLALYDLYCADDNSGYIEVAMEGGSGDFEYEWSNGEDGPVLEDIPAGSYELLVTDVVSGCTWEDEYYVDEPGVLEIDFELENAPCDNSGPGSVDFIVDGGTFPFTFEFENFETQSSFVYLEPGTYEVTVMDGNGCEEYVHFNIEADDMPVAQAVASGHFNCIIDTVFLLADSSSTGMDIVYNWFDPSDIFIGSGDSIQVDSAGLYTLEVYDDAADCSSFTQVWVGQDTVNPTAVATALGDIDCTHAETTVSGAGSTNDTTVIYSWTTPDGLILSAPDQQDISVGQAGTYFLTVLDTLSGCFQTAEAQVTAIETPDVVMNGQTEFCMGEIVSLCVELAADETAGWTMDGNPVGQGPCITIDEAGMLQVTVSNIITGCSASDDVTLIEFETPSIDINGSLSFCESTGTQLCADLEQNERVEWYLDGSLISEDDCIEMEQPGELTVNVINVLQGCASSQALDITADMLPEFEMIAPDILDCTTSSTFLMVDTDAENSVVWYNNQGQEIGTGTSVEINNPGTYNMTVTSPEGCVAESPVLVESNPDDIPESAFDYEGQEFEFNFSDQSTGTINEYLWTFGDGNMSTAKDPVHIFTAPGYYDVCLTTINDCGQHTACKEVLAKAAMQISSVVNNISCYGSDDGSILVTVFGGLPALNYEWEGPGGQYMDNEAHDLVPGEYNLRISDAAGEVIEQQYFISQPEEMEAEGVVAHTTDGQENGAIEVEVSGGNGDYEILWNHGGTSFGITNLPAGVYTATITDGRGCEIEVVYTVENSTSVNEIAELNTFDVYPNPVHDALWISLDFEGQRDYKLTVISSEGKVVYSNTGSTDNYRARLDVTDLAAGIYLVKIGTDSGIAVKKLLVAR